MHPFNILGRERDDFADQFVVAPAQFLMKMNTHLVFLTCSVIIFLEEKAMILQIGLM